MKILRRNILSWLVVFCIAIGYLMCNPTTVQAVAVVPAQLMQTSNVSVEADEENSVQELSDVKQSTVKKAAIVANRKARIDWTRSKGADGYILYRRTANTKQWTKLAVLAGESQTYGYDAKADQKIYYYYTAIV